MNKKLISSVLVASVLMSGCTWKDVPKSPEYNKTHKIPLKIGISTNNSQYSSFVVDEIKKSNTFSDVVFPYRNDDQLDAVLDINITGGWKADMGKSMVAGLLTGATLGLAGAAIGPGMEGEHHTSAKISKKDSTPIDYNFTVKNYISWGMFAKDIATEADDLQIKSITAKLLEEIYNDKDSIIGKSKQ